MIGLILLGAYVLNYVITQLGVPQTMAQAVGRSAAAALGDHAADHRVLPGARHLHGRVLHGDHHHPVIFPVVMALGYDPIWFGVIVTMLVEIALISPPDGTVLYVLQGMRRDGGAIADVFAGVMPFVSSISYRSSRSS